MVLVHAFFLFDQNITKETVAIMDDFPSIIYSVAKILRLCDDLEGAKVKSKSLLLVVTFNNALFSFFYYYQ